MRKITEEAISAFLAGQDFHKSNTQVVVSENETSLFLHGNKIAKLDNKGVLSITTAGWPSPTTRERLNGLPGVSVYQKDHTLYLNNQEWDGSWTEVS